MLAGDISEEALSERLVALAVERFGGLDIAINNAGIAQSFVRLPQVPSDEARRIIDIDLMGVFYAMKYQLPQMERQYRQAGKGGAIVNIASVAGLGGAPRLSVYAAAKHARGRADALGGRRICDQGHSRQRRLPGLRAHRHGRRFRKMTGKSEAEAIADLTRGVPMKRVAEIDEVVEVILFAADPKNSFMTGHALAVDGGIAAI